MTAAAGAGRGAAAIGSTGAAERTAAISVVVAGGLVEGLALGTAQAAVLSRLLPRLRSRRYVLATVVVAGLGWAVGSLPQVLSTDSGASPPVGLVVLGGAGIGVVTGPLLGGVQALALRGAVADPARWVPANLLAWPAAMALIFLGAGLPGADWSLPAVLVTGAATGAAAGGVLGAVTRRWLPGGAAGMQVISPALARRMGEQLKRG